MDFDFVKFHAAYANANPTFQALIDNGAGQTFVEQIIVKYGLPQNVKSTLVLCLNFQLLSLNTEEDTSLILSQIIPVELIPAIKTEFAQYFSNATSPAMKAVSTPPPTSTETVYSSTQSAILREAAPAPTPTTPEPRWDTSR